MPSTDARGNDSEKAAPHKQKSSSTRSYPRSSATPMDLSSIPCRFFKVGACTAGSSCPFSHVVHEPAQHRDACAWFIKGNCKFGHKCALAHVLPGQSMSMDRTNKKAAQPVANGGVPPTPSRKSRGAKEDHALQHGNPSTGSGLLTLARPPMAMTLKATRSAPAPPVKDTEFHSINYNTRILPSTAKPTPAKQQSDDDEFSLPTHAENITLPINIPYPNTSLVDPIYAPPTTMDSSLVRKLLGFEPKLHGSADPLQDRRRHVIRVSKTKLMDDSAFPIASDQASSIPPSATERPDNESPPRLNLIRWLLGHESKLWDDPAFPIASDQASSDADEDWVTDSNASTNEGDECSAVQQQASALSRYESYLHSSPPTEESVRVPPLSANFPRPPDLTPYISKANDQYVAGGGFGDVYRCWYKDGSPKEVAVKAFRFKFAIEEDASERLNKMVRRELGIWRRLDHKNIVPFLGIAHGFGMHGAMSLVSSWMPNESLHHFLAKHDVNLVVRHRFQLLLDVSNGLHYLHSFPIVHGDLNCNNVLLDADYTARLTDFGFASLVGEIPEGLSYMQRSTARPGALRWIAPEQVDPEETFTRTPKSDIYSFGCVALQMLSGKQPWSEVREDSAVVLRLAKGQRPGRPTSRAIDDPHWGLIQRCWSPMVERPTTEAIISAIGRFLSCCPESPPLCEALLSWSDVSSGEGVC